MLKNEGNFHVFTVVIAALAIAMGASWWVVSGSRSWPRIYHYRLTLYVDTPEGPRVGSSVSEVKTRFCDGIFDNIIRGEFGDSSCPLYFTTLKGEATVVDMDSRGSLFSLLVGERDRIGQGYRYKPYIVADWVSPFWHYAGVLGTDVRYREYLDKLSRHKSKEELDLTYVPMLVRFGDIAKPNNVKIVDPFNLSESFGSGVVLKRATFEITDDPVTSEISDRLPWLKDKSSNAAPISSSLIGLMGEKIDITPDDFQSDR